MGLRIPYPILLVVGGSLLGFVPGLPRVELDPDLVFILFLPPLLYASAVFTSWRDFRANVRTISLLAVGLVLMTTFVVAAVVHFVIGLPWAASLVLGAIVSPTDAMAAVVTGAFSAWEAGLQFVVGAAGGIAFGFLIGWVVVWTRRHLADEPSIQTTVSLLTPFVAYLVAEELPPYVWHGLGLPGELHLSGVLAVVVTGLYLGRRGPYILSSPMRLQEFAVAELLTFLLNGLIFILIGLQLRNVVGGLSRFTVGELIAYAVLVSLTVVLVRMVWVFLATYVPRWVSRQLRERGPRSPGAA